MKVVQGPQDSLEHCFSKVRGVRLHWGHWASVAHMKGRVEWNDSLGSTVLEIQVSGAYVISEKCLLLWTHSLLPSLVLMPALRVIHRVSWETLLKPLSCLSIWLHVGTDYTWAMAVGSSVLMKGCARLRQEP
jgi:hypothetical protein